MCLPHDIIIKRGFVTFRANFPKALAAEAIVRTIKTHLDQSRTTLVTVKFVLYDKESIDAYVYELNRST